MNRVNDNDSWVRSPDGSRGFTCSYITGCWNGCDYCFARNLANGRVKTLYLSNPNTALLHVGDGAVVPGFNDPFWPRVWPEKLEQVRHRRKPTGIFLNIMGDWAHKDIPAAWKDAMFQCMRDCPQHVFYMLTKCYDQLPLYKYPDKCLVGASVIDAANFATACKYMKQVDAKHKFLSIEPLLGQMVCSYIDMMLLQDAGISWVIIGAATGLPSLLAKSHGKHPELKLVEWNSIVWTLQPPVSWVTDIVRMCKKAGIKVFLKNNLYPGFDSIPAVDLYDRPWWVMPDSDGYELRQEVLVGQ